MLCVIIILIHLIKDDMFVTYKYLILRKEEEIMSAKHGQGTSRNLKKSSTAKHFVYDTSEDDWNREYEQARTLTKDDLLGELEDFGYDTIGM